MNISVECGLFEGVVNINFIFIVLQGVGKLLLLLYHIIHQYWTAACWMRNCDGKVLLDLNEGKLAISAIFSTLHNTLPVFMYSTGLYYSHFGDCGTSAVVVAE